MTAAESGNFIRAARAADVPRLKDIRSRVLENRLSDPASVREEDYSRFIADGTLWVWDEGDALAGFAALDAGKAILWALFVEKPAEGRGIGRALLSRAVAEAASRGLPALSLTTARGSRAEALYRSAGWQLEGTDAGGDLAFRLDLQKIQAGG